MLDAVAITVRSPKARARVTNNLRALHGVDGRSARGKRYRDLLDSLIVEFGTDSPVRLRELAGLMFTREMMQAAVVNGDIAACEDLVRLSNVIERKEKALRAARRRQASDAPPSLHEHLTGRARQRAAP